MALCRAPYMMLVQPMSGISILSHCLKSSTFNHLKLSTKWVAKNHVLGVSTWRLRKECLQFVYIELHVSESVVPRMVRFHLYPTSVQSFSTRATFGPGDRHLHWKSEAFGKPQKCDDRVDHKQTKTTPSKHIIFSIGQLQRRRLPCLPYLPYIPYLTYLAYIARPQTYHTLHYSTLQYITLHYITLHYITLHYITLNQIKLKFNSMKLHHLTYHTDRLNCVIFANPRQTHLKLRNFFTATHFITAIGTRNPSLFVTSTGPVKPPTRSGDCSGGDPYELMLEHIF